MKKGDGSEAWFPPLTLAYLSIVYDVSWRTLCRVRNETSCIPTTMTAITQSQGPDLFRASCLYIITYNTVSVYSMFSPERAKAIWTVSMEREHGSLSSDVAKIRVHVSN